MRAKTVLVTGSCGLIGSEVSVFFSRQGFRVVGNDSKLGDDVVDNLISL